MTNSPIRNQRPTLVPLAVIFPGVAFYDYLKAEGKLTIARGIWLWMALIFAGEGIAFTFYRYLSGSGEGGLRMRVGRWGKT